MPILARRRRVLFEAYSVVIRDAEIVEGPRFVAFGCHGVPRHRFGRIGGNADTVLVGKSDHVHGSGIALRRCEAKKPHGLRSVLQRAALLPVRKPDENLRLRVAALRKVAERTHDGVVPAASIGDLAIQDPIQTGHRRRYERYRAAPGEVPRESQRALLQIHADLVARLDRVEQHLRHRDIGWLVLPSPRREAELVRRVSSGMGALVLQICRESLGRRGIEQHVGHGHRAIGVGNRRDQVDQPKLQTSLHVADQRCCEGGE